MWEISGMSLNKDNKKICYLPQNKNKTNNQKNAEEKTFFCSSPKIQDPFTILILKKWTMEMVGEAE